MKIRPAAAFTLIELLVCIAIIALLCAIIFPILISSRKKSQATACISNMKQCGQSVEIYASDYDDCYPDFQAWQRWSKLHHNSLPSCPLVKVTEDMKTNLENYQENFLYYRGVPGYAMNSDIQLFIMKIYLHPNEHLHENIRECRTSDVAFPSTTVMLCETSVQIMTTLGPDPYKFMGSYPFGVIKDWERHTGGANYAFCDGHVKWYRAESVSDAAYQIVNGVITGNDGTHPSFKKSRIGDDIPVE